MTSASRSKDHRPMLCHCVLLRWNPDTTDEQFAAIASGLDQLAKMPAIEVYRHGPDAGISDGNWDYAIVGDFASVDDYHTYATDPFHLELIADVIAPCVAARAATQYEFG